MFKKNKPKFFEWGWIYWNGLIYHSVLRLLQGKAHGEMYKRVAEIVGSESVLDLCCGDGRLSRWLSHTRYTGIEMNPVFVKSMRRRGLAVIEGDVRLTEFPPAECAVLIESLYHFLPDVRSFVDKILSHPFQKVIVVESLSHLSRHSVSWVSTFALWSTRVNGRSFQERLSSREFQEMMKECGFVRIKPYSKHFFAIWERGKKS